jgi:hypothetical protein
MCQCRATTHASQYDCRHQLTVYPAVYVDTWQLVFVSLLGRYLAMHARTSGLYPSSTNWAHHLPLESNQMSGIGWRTYFFACVVSSSSSEIPARRAS